MDEDRTVLAQVALAVLGAMLSGLGVALLLDIRGWAAQVGHASATIGLLFGNRTGWRRPALLGRFDGGVLLICGLTGMPFCGADAPRVGRPCGA